MGRLGASGEGYRTDTKDVVDGFHFESGCGGPGQPPCVSAPGFGEGFIPIWGSGRQAINDFQNGSYWWAGFNTGMAVSDVFLVKSIVTGIGKGAWKFGSHSWAATRAWALKRGYTQPGQDLHHWFITQARARRYNLQWLANQPWNLLNFETHSLHMRAGHGQNFLGEAGYSLAGQLWFGTPIWFKAFVGSLGGREIQATAR